MVSTYTTEPGTLFREKRVFDVMHAFIKDSIEKGLKKRK